MVPFTITIRHDAMVLLNTVASNSLENQKENFIGHVQNMERF